MAEQDKVSYFIKDEASIPLTGGDVGNYTGFGVKTSSSTGTYETMLAFKSTESSTSGFGEFKYTSPKLGGSNWSIESRTRAMSDETVTQRVAAKYSTNLSKDVSIYEIAGVNSKFSLHSGMSSVTPVSLTGVGYNVSKNVNVYGEVEVSKSYNVHSGNWGKISPNAYVGMKISF